MTILSPSAGETFSSAEMTPQVVVSKRSAKSESFENLFIMLISVHPNYLEVSANECHSIVTNLYKSEVRIVNSGVLRYDCKLYTEQG